MRDDDIDFPLLWRESHERIEQSHAVFPRRWTLSKMTTASCPAGRPLFPDIMSVPLHENDRRQSGVIQNGKDRWTPRDLKTPSVSPSLWAVLPKRSPLFSLNQSIDCMYPIGYFREPKFKQCLLTNKDWFFRKTPKQKFHYDFNLVSLNLDNPWSRAPV